MSPLKETAIRLIQDMPEEKIGLVLHIIKGLREDASTSAEERNAAYQDLLGMRRSIPDLDYEKELAEYRTERYASAT